MTKKLYTPEETAKKFESLPKEIKDLLYSFEMTSIITKVGEKHGLHIDQMDELNTETAYVMMGLTEPKDFSGILVEDLGIDQAKADAIISDINEMLFSKIRAAMNQPSAIAPAMPPKAPLADVLPKMPGSSPVAAPSTPLAPAAGSIPEMKPSFTPLSAAAAPIATPAMPMVAPSIMPAISSAPKIEMHPADIALSEKTVVVAPSAPAAPAVAATPAQKPVDAKAVPPKPTDYKADPYREPIN